MKRDLLRLPGAVAAFVCAAAGIAVLYWLYASRSVHPWDPLIVMPVVGLASGETRERDLTWLDWSLPVDLSPDGKVGVIAERFEMDSLRSLHDLTIDARGNVYWTDPAGSSVKTPVGHVYRLRPDGRVDRLVVASGS